MSWLDSKFNSCSLVLTGRCALLLRLLGCCRLVLSYSHPRMVGMVPVSLLLESRIFFRLLKGKSGMVPVRLLLARLRDVNRDRRCSSFGMVPVRSLEWE